MSALFCFWRSGLNNLVAKMNSQKRVCYPIPDLGRWCVNVPIGMCIDLSLMLGCTELSQQSGDVSNGDLVQVFLLDTALDHLSWLVVWKPS